MHLRIPDSLRQAFEKIVKPNGRHKQNNHRLSHQWPQHNPLNNDGQDYHHGQCDRDGEPEINAHLQDSDKSERSKQYHRALGEIKNP